MELAEMTPADRARDNFARHIERNRYPGRGLVVARASSDDAWLFVYFIMGRSENSRNRRFVADGKPLDQRLPRRRRQGYKALFPTFAAHKQHAGIASRGGHRQ